MCSLGWYLCIEFKMICEEKNTFSVVFCIWLYMYVYKYIIYSRLTHHIGINKYVKSFCAVLHASNPIASFVNVCLIVQY